MCAQEETQAAHVKQQVEIDAETGQHDSDNPDCRNQVVATFSPRKRAAWVFTWLIVPALLCTL